MAEDIQQKFHEIQEQKERLNTAKQNLKTAISGKGVTVPDGTKLDEYYTLVNNIQQGGSGGDSELPNIELSNLSIDGGVLVINDSVKVDGVTGFAMLDIQGVGDLAPENIVKGKTICGIGGAFVGNSGGWDIYQIKSYIPAESIVQSYSFNLTESGYYADEINGVYVRKTKEGFHDRYVNAEKGKVLLAICYIPEKYVEYSESLTDIRTKKWIIIDVKDSDSYTSEDIDTTNLKYSQSEGWNDNAVSVAYWWCRAEGTGRFDPFYPSNSNYPISVNEWHPEAIIGNKAIGYSEGSPIVSNEDTYLNGFQYSVEVGKSYVVHDGYVIGHPCFMPDLRITLKMSGMDDYDANANGIYTQNDFNKASQTSTWSNANGYVIKYDYMNSQWGCFATNGNVVANGGYGDSPLGATWYEMVQLSGAEVTLELYEEPQYISKNWTGNLFVYSGSENIGETYVYKGNYTWTKGYNNSIFMRLNTNENRWEIVDSTSDTILAYSTSASSETGIPKSEWDKPMIVSRNILGNSYRIIVNSSNPDMSGTYTWGTEVLDAFWTNGKYYIMYEGTDEHGFALSMGNTVYAYAEPQNSDPSTPFNTWTYVSGVTYLSVRVEAV